jgi:hypothetical protein
MLCGIESITADEPVPVEMGAVYNLSGVRMNLMLFRQTVLCLQWTR